MPLTCGKGIQPVFYLCVEHMLRWIAFSSSAPVLAYFKQTNPREGEPNFGDILYKRSLFPKRKLLLVSKRHT